MKLVLSKVKFYVIAVALIGILAVMSSCGNSSNNASNASLVGTWNWQGQEALVLNSNGTYRWMGVDYGALGSRWSSNGNGLVSYNLAGFTVSWFTYSFTNDNTIVIEYVVEPGISYTLHRVR